MRELILSVLNDVPGIDIVGEVAEEVTVREFVGQIKPDFVLVTLGPSLRRPKICDMVLTHFPDVRILAIAPERDQSMLYWKNGQIHSAPVESSQQGILSVLRMQRDPRVAQTNWPRVKAS